jgi:tRNA(adenine34) deaminase
MKVALFEAEKAAKRGEVPVGASLLDSSGNIIVSSGNRNIELNDPTAHAEILVIREACKIYNAQRLIDCSLYVTLEPCPMCATAISFARIKRLYFGAYDMRFGAIENGMRSYSASFFIPEIYGGIEEASCTMLLKGFFQDLRTK